MIEINLILIETFKYYYFRYFHKNIWPVLSSRTKMKWLINNTNQFAFRKNIKSYTI